MYPEIDVIVDESSFNIEKYKNYIRNCNYIIYFGFDEGAFCVTDAVALNIPVIATKQGYHKDLNLPIGSELHSKANMVYDSIVRHIEVRKKKIASIENYNIEDKKNDKKEFGCAMLRYVRVLFVYNNFIRNTKNLKQDIKQIIKIFFKLNNIKTIKIRRD